MADEEDASESPPPPPISTGEVELTFQQSSIVHPEAASTNRDAQFQTRQRTPPRRLEIPPPPPSPAQGFYPSTQASLGASRHNIIRNQIQIQSQRLSSSWNTQRRWESHSLSSFESEMQVESQMPTNQDNIAHAESSEDDNAGPSNGHLPNAAESSEEDNAPVDDHTTLHNGNAQHPFSASTSQNSTDDED